jgi:hypothetical protein
MARFTSWDRKTDTSKDTRFFYDEAMTQDECVSLKRGNLFEVHYPDRILGEIIETWLIATDNIEYIRTNSDTIMGFSADVLDSRGKLDHRFFLLAETRIVRQAGDS